MKNYQVALNSTLLLFKNEMYWVQMKNSACVGCVHLLNFHLEAPFSRYISFLNDCSGHTKYHKVLNESYGFYLSNYIPRVSVGQVVGTPQPCKVGHIPKINWNAKKCTFLTRIKNLFLAHFFSKSCHLKTDKDFSTKPTPSSHTYSNFSVKESRDNLSQSILKYLNLKSGLNLS